MLALVLLLLLSFHPSGGQTIDVIGDKKYCEGDSSCPTWFICNAQSRCQCGSAVNDIVACKNELQTSAVLDCHCVTYDNETGSTYAGACFYNCENHRTRKNNDIVYYALPKRPKMLLNKSACSYFHRTGLLCGECEPGHSPLVLSYSLSCVECPDGHKNWWRFFLAAFVYFLSFELDGK